MKLKNLICVGAIMFSFMACTQDDPNGPQGGNENGEGAYLSLAISMPNGETTSRGIDEGEGTDEGTYGEQKVSSLMVLCYDESGNAVTENYKKTYLAGELTPKDPNPSTGDKSTTYIVPAFKLSAGVKKVVVIVNPLASEFGEATSLDKMRDVIEFTKDDVTAISTNEKFMMTNANIAVNQDKNGGVSNDVNPTSNGEFYADGSIYVDVQGTVANPTLVTIPVERVVAKIMDVTYERTVAPGKNKYKFEVTGVEGDSVTFTNVALINANTKFYPIKNIRDSEKSNNDYVVDPNFIKDQQDITEFYFNKFVGTDKDVDWKLLKNSPVFYSLENTMIVDEQKNGYTTGLYYEAKYQLKDGPEDQNIYKYLGQVYNYDGLKAIAGLSLNVDDKDLTDTDPAAEYAKLGITKYEGGICYYPYWIRHVNNKSATEMGVMEFAVVRNNVYKMSINSVSGIGTPTPENPDPNKPDETADIMLQVVVKVLPWTVRNNSIDF